MAPVTPSPFRFLSGQRQQRRPSPTKDNTASPDLHEPKPQGVSLQQLRTGGQQFAITPRFSAGRPRHQPIAASRSPPRPTFVNAGRVREDVQETLENDDADDEMLLDNEHHFAVPTIEAGATVESEWTRTLPHSPKRRRIDDTLDSTSAAPSPPQRQLFKHPQTPASHLPRPFPHFAHRSHTPTSDEAVPHQWQRPAFLRPLPAQAEPSEPLPETFSPHRRGQKFVSGGMAATVQGWIVDAGQAAIQSRRGQTRELQEAWTVRIWVEQVSGRDPYLILGRVSHGELANVLLSAINPSAGDGERGVEIGDVIGVRAPTWEAQVDGLTWRIGVDWRVLP